jgi:hypothetical protein
MEASAMIRNEWTVKLVRAGLALGLLALTAAVPAAADGDESYGYFRALDGSATLIQAGSATRAPAEINQPVMAGDRILVAERSRVEIVLPDRNLLRLDGGTEITLEQLAASPDRDDPTTVLRLHEGNLLLTVLADSLGDQLPRIDTANASVYPQDYGTYRITSSQGTWTEVTVRSGKAEVVAGRGSETVRADETATVDGERSSSIDIDSAASYDSLEHWADRLRDEARYASSNDNYLDDSLRYQAAPLARYGAWISISGRSYWRPRVDVGWRPYSQGRWTYTPAGLTWVSYEPWGWVPYHYGSWDYLPSYGWVWQAGYTWSPAWVYWYWGPSYVGWCPTGYYTSFYRHDYASFRFGVYGWAGGSWDHWNHWTFVDTDYFRGHRNGYHDGRDGRRDDWNVGRHAVPIDELRRHGPLDQGVVTTDTRPLRPDTWDDPRHGMRVLTESPGGRPRNGAGELPDVTPFIERRHELPAGVVRTVVADGGGDQTGRGGARPGGVTRDRNGRGAEPAGGVATIPTDPSTDRRESAPRPANPSIDNRGEQRGEQPRVGRSRPEGGGAPRPEATENREPPSSSRSRDRGNQGGDSRGGYARPETPRSYNPPPSSSRERERDQGQQSGSRGGYSRPEPPPSYSPPPSSSRERERESSPPPSSSRERERESSPPPSSSRERERESSPPPSSSHERERESSPPPSSSHERSRPAEGSSHRESGSEHQSRERRPPAG